MAAQLKNILNFINIPVGGSQTLPHGLNNNAKKLVPDILTPGGNGGSATIIADNINVTVTNISADPLSLEILCEAWHTIERAFGPRQVVALAPQPFVVGTSGGAQNAATQFVFVYRQGGIAGGNVYSDWATLMAAKSLVQGVKYLQIDSTIVIQGSVLLPGTLTFVAGVVTYTAPAGAPAIPAAVVGQEMQIAGASNAGNNGEFIVATRISASQITFANASGVTDNNFLGVLTILGGFTCITPAVGATTGPGVLNGKWDMTDTEVCGFASPSVGGSGPTWQFGGAASGGDVQFENWQKMGSEVGAICLNTTLAPIIVPALGTTWELGTGYTGDFPTITNNGTTPFWDCSQLTAGNRLTLRVDGGITGSRPAIDFGAGVGRLSLTLKGIAQIGANMVTGTNPAAVIGVQYGSGDAQFGAQPNLASTITFAMDFTRLLVNPPSLLQVAPVPSIVALTLALNTINLYNTTAGDIAQTLPVTRTTAPGTGALNALNTTGMYLIIKNKLGANNVQVSPAAGNTIDGGAGPVAIAAGKAGMFYSDGITDWIQILP